MAVGTDAGLSAGWLTVAGREVEAVADGGVLRD